MSYASLIVLLAYLGAVQFVSRFEVRAIYGALIAVALPYAITLVLGWISAVGYNQPVLPSIFTIESVLVVILQFAVALPIFHKIKQTESLSATVGWAIGGLVLIAIVAPYVVSLLPL